MDYYKFSILCPPDKMEILIALFSSQPFEMFEEKEEGFDAFLPVVALDRKVEIYVESLRQQHDFSMVKTLIPGQNWNRLWESNFEPVVVGDFCGIRADFHPPLQQVAHEIVINPKMAFGTGHHETTFIVIQHMQRIAFTAKNVLDFGCGTGILSILASKLGADEVDAVDIEEQSFLNTQENAKINGVSNIHAIHGTLNDVPQRQYDVILANINRHVILDSLPTLSGRLLAGGILVASGILLTDEQMVVEAQKKAGFRTLEILKKNNWLSIKSVRQD
ncbi:MAG: 50S ribosomal protein L11 methyltransferase [Saprospiraceae bacterium]|nr:MAG: 50S ribosomal protein L11 methyltransferase [Saprospiraceae bacterium]